MFLADMRDFVAQHGGQFGFVADLLEEPAGYEDVAGRSQVKATARPTRFT